MLPKPARLVLLALALPLGIGFVGSRILAARAERRWPPLGETVEVDGLAQHVLDVGSGDVVVFVHGAFGGLQDFAATVLEEASRRYRCLAWDRPGHGYSERPEGDVDPDVQARRLLALLRRLDVERAVLVGFSYGGAVTLAAALEDPDRVRGVLLLNGPSHPWPDPLDLEYRIAGTPVLGRLVSEVVATPLGHLFSDSAVEAAFDPLPVPPLFERSSPLALALRPASYRANMDDIRRLKPFLRAQAEHYGELIPPVVALVSEGDTVVSPTLHAPVLVEAAPRARQVRIPGAGHQLLYTHPRLVLDTLDALVAEVTAANGSDDPARER